MPVQAISIRYGGPVCKLGYQPAVTVLNGA